MNSSSIEEIKKILAREAEAINSIPVNGNFARVVEMIHEKVHGRGGKIIASGMGKAGHVANHMATTLSSTGTPALFLHPSEAQHGDLGVIRENDVLLVLTPTTSATTMAVIGDVLVVLLMKKIKFTALDYAKRHHGGYLGQKSRESLYENQ